MLEMESDKLVNVDIANSISIGKAERFIAYVVLNTFETPTGHGGSAGIYERHLPGLDPIVMYFYLVFLEIKGDI